jgi:hypothetical protein
MSGTLATDISSDSSGPSGVSGVSGVSGPFIPDTLVIEDRPASPGSRALAVEERFDGQRYAVHKRGKSVMLQTEDAMRDRSSVMPQIADEVRDLSPDSLILDAEGVMWGEDGPLPRERMGAMIAGNKSLKDKKIIFNVFDCLYYEGRDIHGLPWEERQVYLKKALPRDTAFLHRVQPILVSNREELEEAVKIVSAVPHSEGAMVKEADSPYDTGRSGSWAKFKIIKEIDVVIIGRRKVALELPRSESEKLGAAGMLKRLPDLLAMSNTWAYRVAFSGSRGGLVPIDSDKKLSPGNLTLRWDESASRWEGTDDPRYWEMEEGFKERDAGEYAFANTYNSAFSPAPKVGDIIAVGMSGMRKFTGDDGMPHYTWMFPAVRNTRPERNRPDIQEVADHLASSSMMIRGGFPKSFTSLPSYLQRPILLSQVSSPSAVPSRYNSWKVGRYVPRLLADIEDDGKQAHKYASTADLFTASDRPLLLGDGPLYVYGVFLVPDTIDTQGNRITSDEILNTIRGIEDLGIDVHHSQKDVDAIKLTQIFQAPSDFYIGKKRVSKGSGVVEMEVQDPEVARRLQVGEFGGLSIDGRAIVSPDGWIKDLILNRISLVTVPAVKGAFSVNQ